ncbi:MAG: HAD hydrolase-like protein, partial [Leptolinea sp.]
MSLNLSKVRAICFDIDGTLSDTDDLWIQRAQPFVRFIKILFPGVPPQSIARRIIMGIETPGNFLYYLLDRFGLDVPAGKIYNWINHSLMRSRPKIYLLVPGIKETIETLATHFPLAVVSSRDSRGTQDFLQTFDLGQHFKAIATSQTCRYTKPFPDPILWAAQQLGV